MLKRVASLFPIRLQQELKRLRFARQVRNGKFLTSEPEFQRLAEWVQPGDWVVDVGANIGHYTCELSRLVQASGRVFSFEPIPHTFELLAANVALLRDSNVTLLNAALSDNMRVVGMSLPTFDSGLGNFYQASITGDSRHVTYRVAALTLDSLGLSQMPVLIKIDAEGHEFQVLKGMQSILRNAGPRLIVEGTDPAVEVFLGDLGYHFQLFPDSPNRLFTRP